MITPPHYIPPFPQSSATEQSAPINIGIAPSTFHCNASINWTHAPVRSKIKSFNSPVEINVSDNYYDAPVEGIVIFLTGKHNSPLKAHIKSEKSGIELTLQHLISNSQDGCIQLANLYALQYKTGFRLMPSQES